MKSNMSLLAFAFMALAVTATQGKEKPALPVIGEIESVTLMMENFQLSARIGTDAKTSSISAFLERLLSPRGAYSCWSRKNVFGGATYRF